MGAKDSPRAYALLIVLKIEKQFENRESPNHLSAAPQPPLLAQEAPSKLLRDFASFSLANGGQSLYVKNERLALAS